MNLFFILALFIFNLIAPNDVDSTTQKPHDTWANNDKQALVLLETFGTRNNSKRAHWKEYTEYHHKNFINTCKWQELVQIFDQFSQGFANLHSHLAFNAEYDKAHLKSTTSRCYGKNTLKLCLKA